MARTSTKKNMVKSLYVFGKYTGTFNISGSTEKTLMNIEASINDAIFRKIPLGLVKFSGLYKSKKLVFNNFSSKWNQIKFH